MLLIASHTSPRRLYEEIFVYSLFYTDLWCEFYRYGILFIRRILHLPCSVSPVGISNTNIDAMLV